MAQHRIERHTGGRAGIPVHAMSFGKAIKGIGLARNIVAAGLGVFVEQPGPLEMMAGFDDVPHRALRTAPFSIEELAQGAGLGIEETRPEERNDVLCAA